MSYNNNFIPDTPSPLSSDHQHLHSHNFTQKTRLNKSRGKPKEAEKDKDLVKDDDRDKDLVKDDERDGKGRGNSFLVANLELKHFPLFKQAPDSFYNKIISNLKLVTYHPQSTIIKMGDPSKSMYWILKGIVSIVSSDGDSIYNELSSGQFFGEIGILFNRPRTANVIAKTKVLIGVLTLKDFNNVLKNFPLMERRIRDEAQERLAMLDKMKHGNNQPPVLPPILPLNKVNKDNLDSSISIQHFIKNLPIFQTLPAHIIHKLALGVEPLKYDPFQYIFYENDLGSDIYFIISGQVEVLNSKDEVLAKLNHGNYFGEMSFLSFIDKSSSNTNESISDSGFKRSASIRSVSTLELIVIRSDLLKNLCDEYPFLIDHMKQTRETRINSTKPESIPEDKQPELVQPQPTIEFRDSFKDVSFKPFEFKFDSRALVSRSVSPVTEMSDDDIFDRDPKAPAFNFNNLYNRSLNPPIHHSSNLAASMPAPSLRRKSQFNMPNDQIDYIPHNKRLKLQAINPRRKSSVLTQNGPLTDSLLIQIFEYLDVVTLMKLRCINRRWRQLLYISPNLCTTLDLTKWNTVINDKILINITKFVGSRPQHINISNCFHITDEGFSYMINEIGISGKIKSLKMKSNWEISAMAIMDLTVPSVGKYLEEIDLSNCRKVRDNVVERLIGWDTSDSQNKLNFGADIDEPEDIGCKKLTKINVGYCKHLTDSIMYHIGEYCNNRLTSLDLTRCTTITDQGFEYWTYKYFPNLVELSLKDCTFLTDKSMISIANSATNLRSLNLNFCCSLTDISLEVLCIGCHHLEFLDLSFCGSAVSDSSLLTISLNLKHLKHLILKGCVRVTRAGIDSLLSSDSLLTYLDVSQCKNSDIYPGSIPAQKLNINPETKSAFVKAGSSDKIIEIVI